MPTIPEGKLRDAILRVEALKKKRGYVLAWIFCTFLSLPIALSEVKRGGSNVGLVFPSGGVIFIIIFYPASFIVCGGLLLYFWISIRNTTARIIQLQK